jgi:selenocysteine lyase/cysteine desulfurase
VLDGLLLGEQADLGTNPDTLRQRIEAGLQQLPKVTIHSRAAHWDTDVAHHLAGRGAAAISGVLAQHDINAPAGSFYAYEASRWLGLGEAGGVRIGLASYNTAHDVDRLIRVLAKTLDHHL